MSRRLALAFVLLLETFAAASGGLAVAAEIPDDKDQVIQKLLDRVDALEREVAALQRGQIQQEPGQQASAPPAAPTQAVATEQQPAPSDDAPATNPTQPDTSSRFNFHGYADAGFLRNVDGTGTKKFEQGEIDLFATERLSSHLTALLEVALETDAESLADDVAVNVERMLLQYRGNDFFNADIGSYRTALGYYSTAYLRGAWLQTAISRPKMFTFEDQGGFLPLHAVGVSVNGRIPSGDLNLHYVAEVGSSRNYGNTAGLALAPSFNRATNLAVFSQPRGVTGLEIGFSTYHDLFSPGAGFQLDRSVWTVHFVYVRGRVEFLNEGMRIGLLDLSVPGAATGLAFYSQFAYRVASSWKPYGRVEYLNAHGTGVIDTAIARQYIPWKTVYTGGIRHDLTDSVALKFELGRETDYMRSGYITAALQLAFAF
ncbi:MAG: hypothetical protein ABSB86_05630 [Bryobacteraceae bacterium]